MDIIQSFPILHHSVDTSNVMYSFLLRQNNKYKSIIFLSQIDLPLNIMFISMISVLCCCFSSQ